jgi:hypothetical protein
MSYDSFSNLFKRIWSKKEDGGTLGTQFNKVKKKENETVYANERGDFGP